MYLGLTGLSISGPECYRSGLCNYYLPTEDAIKNLLNDVKEEENLE